MTGLTIIFLWIVIANYSKLKIGKLELKVIESICLWI